MKKRRPPKKWTPDKIALRYTGNRLFLSQLLPSRAVIRFIDAKQISRDDNTQQNKVINFENELKKSVNFFQDGTLSF